MNAQPRQYAAPDAPMYAFVREPCDTVEILHILGEVDISNAGEFEAAIREIGVEDVPGIVVDLSGCSYMDSSGLRVLATVRNAFPARIAVVVPVAGSVHRIFEISGLGAEFGAFDSVDDALKYANQPVR